MTPVTRVTVDASLPIEEFYGTSNRSCVYCNFSSDNRYNLIVHLAISHPDEVRNGDIDKYTMPKGVISMAKESRKMYDEMGEPIHSHYRGMP